MVARQDVHLAEHVASDDVVLILRVQLAITTAPPSCARGVSMPSYCQRVPLSYPRPPHWSSVSFSALSRLPALAWPFPAIS